LPILDDLGRTCWTTAEALAQLQVSRSRLADWVRRGMVERPRRRGRLALYVAEHLLDAELRTRASGRGRARGARGKNR